MSKLSAAAEEIRKTIKPDTTISIQELVGSNTTKWDKVKKQILQKIEDLEFKAKAEETDFCGRMETFFYLLIDGIEIEDQSLAVIIRIGRTFSNQIGLIDGTPKNWEPLRTSDYSDTDFPIDTYQNLLLYLENELKNAKDIRKTEIDELENDLKETRTFQPRESLSKKLFV